MLQIIQFLSFLYWDIFIPQVKKVLDARVAELDEQLQQGLDEQQRLNDKMVSKD